jgi:hypothetical protein
MKMSLFTGEYGLMRYQIISFGEDYHMNKDIFAGMWKQMHGRSRSTNEPPQTKPGAVNP